MRGNGYRGDIAIDDLSIAMKPSCQLYGGSLPAVGSTVSPVTTAYPNNCQSNQFACVSDGKCLQLGQVCDFNKDCADGSDERNCRKWYNISPSSLFFSYSKNMRWSFLRATAHLDLHSWQSLITLRWNTMLAGDLPLILKSHRDRLNSIP